MSKNFEISLLAAANDLSGAGHMSGKSAGVKEAILILNNIAAKYFVEHNDKAANTYREAADLLKPLVDKLDADYMNHSSDSRQKAYDYMTNVENWLEYLSKEGIELFSKINDGKGN